MPILFFDGFSKLTEVGLLQNLLVSAFHLSRTNGLLQLKLNTVLVEFLVRSEAICAV